MNLQFTPILFLQAVASAIMLIGLLISTKTSDRTYSFYILFISLLLIFTGTLIRVVLYFFDIDYQLSSLKRKNDTFQEKLDAFALAMVLLSIFLKPLFISSLEKILRLKQIILVLLIWLVVSIALIYLIDGLTPTIGIRSSTVLILISAWFLYSLKNLNRKNNFLNQSIYIMVWIFCILHSIFLIIFISLNFSTSTQYDNLQAYSQFDLILRFLRIPTLLCLDMLCFFYWIQNYSTEAIRSRQNKKRIDQLLIEKDTLIKKLINANAMSHTGALSAGLAHELNQFLARIQLDVESAKIYAEKTDDVKKIITTLDRALDANQGAAILILNLRKLFLTRQKITEKYDLNQLVGSVIDLYAYQIVQINIKLEKNFKASILVNIQESLIRQVIVNLISNAMAALLLVSNRDRKLVVETKTDQNFWTFCVQDNGLGILPENVPHIFSLFATTKVEGTGVGLWLSRYIIEQHGGTLTFQNHNPGGVTFIIQVPIIHVPVTA